ncbi:MAG: TerB family tellurite resistance protein, partial [Myxococcota bacterium]
EVTPVEEKAIEVILRDVGQMKPADAQLLSALAREKRTLFGGLDDFQVTKIYTELTTEEEKLRLLDCLFAVAAADEMVHVVEEEDIRQISIGLGLRHAQYIAARQRVTAYRAVMQDTSS